MATATQKDHTDPIRQFSIFLANKAGRLLAKKIENCRIGSV